MSETQTTTQVPGAAKPEGGVSAQASENPNPGTGQQTDKTYTAEELAKQVQETLAAEREKWEKDS